MDRNITSHLVRTSCHVPTHTGVVLTAWTLALAVVFCVRWRPASFLLTSRLFWSQSLSRNCWWSISAVTSAPYTANCSWESIVFSIQQHNGWTFMVKSLWIMEWDVQWVTSTWRERICFKEDAVVVTFSTTWFIQVGLECCSWNNILCCSGNNISVHLNLLLKLNGCCKSILKTAVLQLVFVISQNLFLLDSHILLMHTHVFTHFEYFYMYKPEEKHELWLSIE